MKIYVWEDPGCIEWGGGIVAVVAENMVDAKAAARKVYDESCCHNLDHIDDIGDADEVKDLVSGAGIAFTWEL